MADFNPFLPPLVNAAGMPVNVPPVAIAPKPASSAIPSWGSAAPIPLPVVRPRMPVVAPDYADRAETPVALALLQPWEGRLSSLNLSTWHVGNDLQAPLKVPTSDEANAAAKVIALTSEVRRQHGLAPLIFDRGLSAVAQAHSEDMAARNYVEHMTPEGIQPYQRVQSFGIRGWNSVGENVGRGTISADRIMEGWEGSPGHRENLLGDFTHIGVGVNLPGRTWTQVFMRRTSAR